ncbi:class I SAM-dependent methyltransferase [Sphingopyxis sp. MC1]|uniref:class I SAM-dependent methyltransferase n=1 Tax=Sphingopyxis sp. MC1 TaxID=1174684 RepID=UPI0002D1FD1D|nr:class I SAM-dependent methyltransferase [Sphingopyxis sp. MC1]ENY83187.1 methyltransferase type 12 [Sphingopyxis sp. MC1]
MAEGARHFLDSFRDPAAVARYSEGPRRFVPGLDGLHRMTGLLLAERVPVDAHILVLGAGGGSEMKAMADAHPGWRFTGVDPAGPMLDLAAQVLGADAHRAELIEGLIDDAPPGPFDGATCLLTLHFLAIEERIRTVAEIRRRLRPGAPFVAAHGSFPQGAGERDRWLDRYAAFAIASGGDPDQVAKARAAVASHVAMLTPQQDEDVLRAAGFTGVEQFYAAFT